MNSNPFTALLAALVLVCATACSKQEEKPASQVVARVNGEEITVHQINFALARAKGITQDDAPQARREILEALIERQIARQQAAQSALDRSAGVILEIEDARSAILARAFRESLVEFLPKPAPFDIKAYYREHPELFAKRRVFDLEELAFVANAEAVVELRGFLSAVRSLKQVADWLQAKGIKASTHRGVRPAELIPLDVLPRINAMNDGDMVLLEGEGGRCRVMRLVASELAPLDEESAVALIGRYLTNRRSAEAVAQKMRQLRDAAAVEYLGEFAKPASKASATRGAASDQAGATRE